MSVSTKLIEQLKNDIPNGVFGPSGSLFGSIRDFAKEYKISYVTAQKTFSALRKSGLVILLGNHQYITYGPINKDSDLAVYFSKFKTEKKRIGMFINRLTNTFFTTVADYISKQLSLVGYELVVLSGDGSFEKEREALESFILMGVDAVISCAGFGDEIGEYYKNYILPTVFLGRYPSNLKKCSAVLVNNVNAGKQVASHLIDAGCKSFVYVGTTQLKDDQDMRLDGFKKQLADHGTVFDDGNIIYIDPEKRAESRADFKNIFNASKKPIGVFCYHDILAVSVIGICNRYKIEIPSDVMLVGFDNLPLCDVVYPRLTSISYRFDIMANEVIDSVFKLLENPNKHLGLHYVNQSLLVRASTTPAKTNN